MPDVNGTFIVHVKYKFSNMCKGTGVQVFAEQQ